MPWYSEVYLLHLIPAKDGQRFRFFQLIDQCLNKGVVQFENFIRQVQMADEE